MKYFLLIQFSIMSFWVSGQHKPAYQIFNQKGKLSNYPELLKKSQKADIVFFGELHNNPIAHWLQLALVKDFFKQKKENLVLGAEMLESDNQLILDEYLSGLISVKKFEEEARLWNNYKTDYKPLVDFAKMQQLRFIATNIPRRYANLVFKQGLNQLDNLSITAKKYIAPLPIEVDLEVPSYKKLLEMAGEHGGENFPHAQAVKDATMAHFIEKNWSKGKLFLHFNGSYHSDDQEGIVWFIRKSNPKINTFTITTVSQKEISSLNEIYQGKADFIICVPEDMTTTY